MTLYFYNCVTTYHLLTWWEFYWGGCLRSSWGLKPAETVWNVSMFLLANAANCRQNPLRFLPPPLFQQRLQNIDMIMYLGRNLCSAYIPVFMRSWACVHRSASYLEDQLVEHLTESVPVSFFPEEQKQMRAIEACESALSSKWTPPLQVDIVLDPWPISFILTTLTVTPHCKSQLLSLLFTS